MENIEAGGCIQVACHRDHIPRVPTNSALLRVESTSPLCVCARPRHDCTDASGVTLNSELLQRHDAAFSAPNDAAATTMSLLDVPPTEPADPMSSDEDEADSLDAGYFSGGMSLSRALPDVAPWSLRLQTRRVVECYFVATFASIYCCG